MKIVFDDPAFSFQLLRILGSTYYGGADIGECLYTAYKIKEGDFESWYLEWSKTAQRVREYGDKCLTSGHKLSACEAYLRASNYFRTAEFFLHINPQDSRIIEAWQNSVDIFRKAVQMLPFRVDFIEIPYERTTLPGYFYKSCDSSESQRPTLILHTGFDGTQEELYTTSVIAALKRGYNCLTFEGPGQGRVIRKQGIPFRHDWEKVVTPVVDYIDTNYNNYCDMKRLALMGISMGGYLAARAAAFEDRISACILDDGVYDIYQNNIDKLGDLKDEVEKGNSIVVNTAIETSMYFSTRIKWWISHGMWTYKAKDPLDYLQKNKDYTLKDVVNKIKCPTLVLEAQNDDDFPGGPKMVYEGLQCPKNYILFTEEEGADDHCQIAALALSNQRIFDWLDGVSLKKIS